MVLGYLLIPFSHFISAYIYLYIYIHTPFILFVTVCQAGGEGSQKLPSFGVLKERAGSLSPTIHQTAFVWTTRAHFLNGVTIATGLLAFVYVQRVILFSEPSHATQKQSTLPHVTAAAAASWHLYNGLLNVQFTKQPRGAHYIRVCCEERFLASRALICSRIYAAQRRRRRWNTVLYSHFIIVIMYFNAPRSVYINGGGLIPDSTWPRSRDAERYRWKVRCVADEEMVGHRAKISVLNRMYIRILGRTGKQRGRWRFRREYILYVCTFCWDRDSFARL